MIYARGIDISQFPDGTPHLKENPSITMDGFVSWHYHDMGEFPIVCMLGEYIKSRGYKPVLYMPYIPNARMDRVHKGDVFTLKFFAKMLNTAIFAETGLNREVDFSADKVEGNNVGSITSVATLINGYRNTFGKPMVLVIQSQLGVPICAYSGDNVYWEVCNDLPKTTKLMIDGKAIYVHRANFQIIDLSLL